MTSAILGYQPKDTPIHRINAVAKLVYFLLTTFALMMTYDLRLILIITVFSLLALRLAKVEWTSVSFVVKIIIVFSVINLVAIYLLTPEFGVSLYGSRTVVGHLFGPYTLILEQGYYEFNLLLKYFASVPLVLVFMLTMNPSEFASSFNRIGIPYQFAYAISLTLRYIPDVQRDYVNIRNAQAARGVTSHQKEKPMTKVRNQMKIVMPLIMTSFNRIETISHAMMLRRFGQNKRRSWYVEKPLRTRDYLVMGLGLIWFIAFFVLFQVNQGRYYNPFK